MTAQQQAQLIGTDQEIPLITGRTRRYVNLDYAASTPPLAIVARAVDAFLSWYSSVHRGAGFTSQVSTAAYEGARGSVRSIVHAHDDDVVIFTRNSTDAVNLLASSLPEQAPVLALATEHHATLLPWRRGRALEREEEEDAPEEAFDAGARAPHVAWRRGRSRCAAFAVPQRSIRLSAGAPRTSNRPDSVLVGAQSCYIGAWLVPCFPARKQKREYSPCPWPRIPDPLFAGSPARR